MNTTTQAIPQFALLGSFSHADFKSSLEPFFIPEPIVEPSVGQKLGPLTWKAAKADDGVVNLLEQGFKHSTYCVAYAFVYVQSPMATQATLLMGGDDGVACRVNGRLVWSKNAQRPMTKGEDIAVIDLEKGWNGLLFKISQHEMSWQFYAAIQCDQKLGFAVKNPRPQEAAKRRTQALPLFCDLAVTLGTPGSDDVGKATVRVTLANRGGKAASGLRLALSDSQGAAKLAGPALSLKGGTVVQTRISVPVAELARVLADEKAAATLEFAGQTQTVALAGGLPMNLLISAVNNGLAGAAAKTAAEKLAKALALAPAAPETFVVEARQGLAALASNDLAGVAAAIDAISAKTLRSVPDYKHKVAHLVGHAHIDMNWLWTYPETVNSAHDSWRQVIAFMDEFPGFTFLQSQPAIYKAIERIDPPLFEKIKARVAKGQWELGGGMMTEGDTNMSSGEALARTFLLGQRYFLSRFGKQAAVGWLPDNFGHVSQLPQILRQAGCEYFFSMRCNPFTGYFWWEGTDGSRVLAYTAGYNGSVQPSLRQQMDGAVPGADHILQPIGVGDHGGGPTRTDILAAQNLDATPHFPSVRFTTAQEFYKALAPGMGNRPTHKGEMQYIFEGCYTTIAKVKEGNRKCEAALYSAEVLASLRCLGGQAYPAEQLRRAWEIVTFNEFHDILCGSAINESNADSVADYKWARSRAEDVSGQALRALADEVKTDPAKGQPIVAFNPHPQAATTLVEAEVFTHQAPATASFASWGDFYGAHRVKVRGDHTPSVMLRDPAGKTIPAQIVSGKDFPPGLRWKVQFLAENLPAGGYRTYYLDPTQPGETTAPIAQKNGSFNTDFFQVDVDMKSGDIKGILDKRSRRQLVPKGKKANALRIYMEKPHGMSGWDIGPIAKTIDLTKADSVTITETGPVRACVESVKTFNRSKFIQRVYIYKAVPRIDFEIEAHWFEQGNAKEDAPMLRAIFPLAIKDATFNCHVPFDVVSRPTMGREVPAQQWVDVADGKGGAALLNQTKYGHSYNQKTGELALTLLRSSYDPDIYPDQGKHVIKYSLVPHQGGWAEAGIWQQGDLYNKPILATEPPSAALGKAHATRPEEATLVTLTPANVAMSGMKQAEEGEELIVRLVETQGQATIAHLTLPAAIKSARRVNLIELATLPEDAPAPTVTGQAVSVVLRAHEIATIAINV